MAAHLKWNGGNGESNSTARLVSEFAHAPGMKECLRWFAREKQWINEQHLQLCRIPAPTFFEQERAQWMQSAFQALGCDARVDKAGNVVAQFTPGYDGPLIALTAHLDTVLARAQRRRICRRRRETARPRCLRQRRGAVGAAGHCSGDPVPPGARNRGRAAAARRQCRRRGRRQSAAACAIFAASRRSARRIGALLILDGPSTDHITSQALASRRFDVTFTGPGGHSWSDYGIGNPVHALSRAITLFTEIRLNGSASPRSSYNFAVLEGGTSINSIPTLARTKVDIRSESSVKLDDIAAQLTSSVERALEIENRRATGGRLSAKIKEIGSRPGGRLPDGSPLLSYIRAVDAHLGIRSHLDCASTDANVPLSMNLPALSIGAGGQGGGAHTPRSGSIRKAANLGLKRILLMLGLLLQDQTLARQEPQPAAPGERI